MTMLDSISRSCATSIASRVHFSGSLRSGDRNERIVQAGPLDRQLSIPAFRR